MKNIHNIMSLFALFFGITLSVTLADVTYYNGHAVVYFRPPRYSETVYGTPVTKLKRSKDDNPLP